jgi:hypothetical protein
MTTKARITGDEKTIHWRIGSTIQYALRYAALDDLNINVLDVKPTSVDAATGYSKVVVSHFYAREVEFKAEADTAFASVESVVRRLLGESVKSVTLKSTSTRDRGGVDKTYSVVILVDREGKEAKALLND